VVVDERDNGTVGDGRFGNGCRTGPRQDKGRDSILKTNVASSLNICTLLLFVMFRTST
jgi:hypothetical protein